VSALESPSSSTWLLRIIGILVLANVAAFLVLGADRPPRPSLAMAANDGGPSRGLAPRDIPQQSLPGVALTFTGVRPGGPGSTATPHCFLLAETPARRARGLMGRRSLGGFSGMAFVYPAASSDSYFMRDTPMPLQIAFFTGSGMFVSSAAMTPCPASRATCPLYSAARPFRLAVEVREDGLAALGVGPGTVAHLRGPCAA